MPIRGNKGIRYANTTQKVRRQWNAREKLIIIMYHEKGHSKRATATKFGIEPKQLRGYIWNKYNKYYKPVKYPGYFTKMDEKGLIRPGTNQGGYYTRGVLETVLYGICFV